MRHFEALNKCTPFTIIAGALFCWWQLLSWAAAYSTKPLSNFLFTVFQKTFFMTHCLHAFFVCFIVVLDLPGSHKPHYLIFIHWKSVGTPVKSYSLPVTVFFPSRLLSHYEKSVSSVIKYCRIFYCTVSVTAIVNFEWHRMPWVTEMV